MVGKGITQLKAQGPSRTCNESKEEGWVAHRAHVTGDVAVLQLGELADGSERL